MELELSTFSLKETIDSSVAMLRERASRRGIALEADCDPSVGAIEADQRKVKQVSFNLLSNAVKFTPEGGRITVRARAASDVAEDLGAGHRRRDRAEDQSRIFEEFAQASSGKSTEASTGLGLTIAKKFVELHGGAIALESAVGFGKHLHVLTATAASHRGPTDTGGQRGLIRSRLQSRELDPRAGSAPIRPSRPSPVANPAAALHHCAAYGDPARRIEYESIDPRRQIHDEGAVIAAGRRAGGDTANSAACEVSRYRALRPRRHRTDRT